jgi:hypothetical protein
MKMTGRFFLSLLLLLLAGCGPGRASWPKAPLALAAFEENGVRVGIVLERDLDGQDALVATYAPLDPDCHLYGKDLPPDGLDGLGRPTLLELVVGSRLQAVGGLSESVPAAPGEGPEGLLVYPPGPVSLRLPLLLPEGAGWFEEQVSITYMVCSEETCLAPTIAKLVPVRVPGRDNP